MADRHADTRRFYDRLEGRIGGRRMLADCNWHELAEPRDLLLLRSRGSALQLGRRVVRRAGRSPHWLEAGGRRTLWARLSQHRGTARARGGNHRGSMFRLLVGIALAQQQGIDLPPSWGVGGDPGAAARRLGPDRAGVKLVEAELEARVSHHIRAMPFPSLNVWDEPGPRSERGTIGRNAIALLSGYREPALDPPSVGGLGHSTDAASGAQAAGTTTTCRDSDYSGSRAGVFSNCVDAEFVGNQNNPGIRQSV